MEREEKDRVQTRLPLFLSLAKLRKRRGFLKEFKENITQQYPISGIAGNQRIFYLSGMNRIKSFVEWNAFGVCTAIGNRLGISTGRIRQYFIYTSLLTMGSPIILYMVLAFWRNMKNYISSTRRNPWYYL